MSAGVRVPWQEARAVAVGLLASLAAGCERIEIAGSVRRGASDVGDIELVAVPRMTEQADGLFEVRVVSALDGLLAGMVADRKLSWAGGEGRVAARGERYQKLTDPRSGLQVDLFAIRPPAQWGVIFLIRTGPAAYSQWLVTEARRRGFHVAGGALHRGGLGCGAIACDVVDTPDERDVYGALGLPWREPVARS